ncbi:hypothetical protein ABT301_12685 [Streptomyces sp. NPDC000987]|uniref:hypothetical protein n=1 Tax=Streptomyces sp. NPDC000987 TaxID=3154374 RepID=UPI00332EB7DA
MPDFAGPAELRVVVGLAGYRVTPDSPAAFFETEWQVTPDADRVGYRCRGGAVEWVPRTQPRGAGRDPADVVDTGGGYAAIGTFVSADLSVAGQTKTGDMSRFVPVSIDAALGAGREAGARPAKACEAVETRSDGPGRT